MVLHWHFKCRTKDCYESFYLHLKYIMQPKYRYQINNKPIEYTGWTICKYPFFNFFTFRYKTRMCAHIVMKIANQVYFGIYFWFAKYQWLQKFIFKMAVKQLQGSKWRKSSCMGKLFCFPSKYNNFWKFYCCSHLESKLILRNLKNAIWRLKINKLLFIKIITWNLICRCTIPPLVT